MKIQDKVAVVTGATSGIGLAISRKIIGRGARGVAIVDLSDQCQHTAEEINREHGKDVALPFQGNVSDPVFRENVFETMNRTFGTVRICIPAAGILRDAMAVKINRESLRAEIYRESQFKEVLDINLVHPTYWAIQTIAGIAEARAAQGFGQWQCDESIQGVVILIGSVSSRGNRGQISYSAAKSGLNAVTATLNVEGLYHGIQTKIIHPGFVDTPMVESMPEDYFESKLKHLVGLGRMIRPDEIADAVVSLIENPVISGPLWADAGLRPLV